MSQPEELTGQFIRAEEFCAFFGISESVLRRYGRRGQVTCLRSGGTDGRVFVPRSELKRILRRGVVADPAAMKGRAAIPVPLTDKSNRPSRKKTRRVKCTFFEWKVFQRGRMYYADGRSHGHGKHSLSVVDQDLVLDSLRQLDARCAAADGVGPVSNCRKVMISRGWQVYLKRCARPLLIGGVAASTLSRYRSVRDKHIRFCRCSAVKGWDQVDDQHVEAYVGHLTKAGRVPSTIYTEVTLLKTVRKFLTQAKLIDPPAPLQVAVRRSQESRRYCFTREQVNAMVDLCDADTDLHWLRDVIVLLATTGMRIGEALALRWPDIHLEDRYLLIADDRFQLSNPSSSTVRTTKGRRSRVVPLHPVAMTIIERLSPRRDGGRLLEGPGRKLLTADIVRRAFRRFVIEPLADRFGSSNERNCHGLAASKFLNPSPPLVGLFLRTKVVVVSSRVARRNGSSPMGF